MYPNKLSIAAGDLSLTLREESDGIVLASLRDLAAERELLAHPPSPLFIITLRHVGTHEEKTLAADSGWRSVRILQDAPGLELLWQEHSDHTLTGLGVRLVAVPVPQQHAWHWSLRVENTSGLWSIWRTIFPQLALARPGDDPQALLPVGPGQLRCDAWDTTFHQEAKYPAGWWWGLQFVATYSSQPAPSGLYVGVHDPYGSTKDILMEGDPQADAVRLRFDHPAPDMGRVQDSVALGGPVVWQLLRGDWYDAAMIYKDWACQHAHWWPALSHEGRLDTPPWMRELCLWAMGGWRGEQAAEGKLKAAVEPVRQLQQFMGLPMGFHWYNWHQIPFDNDYPHYFPALAGFPEAVRALQDAGVYVMPYINGRLWDTRDRGTEDFEFSRVALPATAKDEEGKPYVETYGSKEADGSPVQLAPMCPTTALWQARVRELVARLFDECGVDGVYIDQVAAAEAKLCMDPTHGHPLGGGHWWNEGYWDMLEGIRAAMPQGRMITTECNAEVFMRWFDGYLTWHWQQDYMVPAFPAVYGGAIQMFGRSYGGTPEAEEPTQHLAWRMRAAQQFVFGEQIGWFNVNLANERMPMRFIRDLARLRWRLRRYFCAGEMARPPKLVGHIPRLKANWQWYNAKDNPWVTTEALMGSAWRMRHENRLVWLFANASDEPITVTWHLDPATYGIAAPSPQGTWISSDDSPDRTISLSGEFARPITFEPCRGQALEIIW